MMKKRKSYEYSHDGVYEDILFNAHGVGLPEGIARAIADRVATSTDQWICDKEMITEDDLRRFISGQLEGLDANLAYAYQNNDKVI